MKKIIAASLLTVLSSATMAGELVPACVEYFKQADQFIASTPEATPAKPKYDAFKKQTTELPSADQETACKQGSELLRQAIATKPAN
ncbi:DUF5339 family protein [Pseudomonas fluorescens]|uniref:Lipoprotein n=1 Tax=Pseudomonas fluorescens TaxID=294 RepID=A0A5E7PQM7_PSEFL|nr:DUF5339 family protein [Pseudomonas fluorescens]VVP52085.1 hypothetical protein PS880_05424 [Pseudomonas fluorescens]